MYGYIPFWRKELQVATEREIVSFSVRNDPHGVRLKNCRKSVRFCLTAWDMATMERGTIILRICWLNWCSKVKKQILLKFTSQHKGICEICIKNKIRPLHTCHIFLGPFWDFLVYFLGQMTFFWDKYCKILGHFLGHFSSAKSVN